MKLKIGVVGSSEAGKTTICNLLGNDGFGDTANSNIPYRPTQSIRIVELTVPKIEVEKYIIDVDCELWELGGNPSLKSMWASIQSDLEGVIIVYDVNKDAHVRETAAFYMHFVTHAPSNILPTQSFIVGNVFRGKRETGVQKIIGIGQRARHIAVNLDDDASYLREEFRGYVKTLAQIVSDRRKYQAAHDYFGTNLHLHSEEMEKFEALILQSAQTDCD